MLRAYISFFLTMLSGFMYGQTLIINEVSQGTGAAEYVELMVVGTPGCSEIPCIDLRGYIIDDNNGQFQAGTGTGIAQGAVRFTQDDFWSCIPIGTTILLYNDADPNVDLPSDDSNMDDGNCTLAIPISSTLFETHPSQPNTNDSTYPTTGWVAGGNWLNISMANSNDSFQIYDPTDMTTPVFSVSWGNNTDNNNIYFSGSATGNVFYLADGDYTNQASWVEGDVAVDQTPGGSNSIANGDWINSMNNSCQPLTPIEVTGTNVDPSCNGDCDGSIDLTTTGGTAPLTFSWDSGQTTEDISGLCAGSYTLTITDVNGCTKDTTITLLEPDPIVITETHIDVACNGGTEGSIDATSTGGTAPLTYSWSNGATTEDISGLVAGDYTLTVTDANLCTETITVTIVEPDPIVITETHVDVGCNGGSDGSIDVTIAGGIAPLTYSWSNGATSEDLSGLIAGDYTLTVTDANGCIETVTITITESDAIVLTLSSQPSSCGNLDGEVSVSAIGGSGIFTYSWEDGNSNVVGTTATVSGLAAGIYTVTVNDGSCTETATVTVSDAGEPTLVLDSYTDVTCNLACDGEIFTTATGGTAPITYSWNSGATTDDISGLCPGTYNLTASDANGCTATLSVDIIEPDAIVIMESHIDVTCNGGSDGAIDITVAGGTSPYSYSWGSGESTEDISGLVAGDYTLTVTDANSCTETITITISEPDAIVLTEVHTDVTCFSLCDGTVDMSVSGGVGPYSYSWNTGENSQDLIDLCPGDYTITVTDANLCTEDLTTTIIEPTEIVLTTSSTPSTCGNSDCDGSIDMTVSGGTAPYVYSWDNGSTTEDLSNLCPGDYNIQVTDGNGCTSVSGAMITEPNGLTISGISTNVSSIGGNDGSIDITVTGGTAPYSYLWDNGSSFEDLSGLTAGTYCVTVTDANGCVITDCFIITEPQSIDIVLTGTDITCFNACDGQVDLTINTPGDYTITWTQSGGTESGDLMIVNGLCPQTVSVLVEDNNSSESATATVILSEPEEIILSETSNDVSCFGLCDGSADITIISGGVAPIAYDWAGVGNSPTSSSNTGLCAGTYPVIVTDANGCIATIDVVITEPSQITLSETHIDVTCFGSCDGSIDVTTTGGTAPYVYSWDNGSTTEDISNLCAEDYTLTVTDANGCVETITVSIIEPSEITLTTSSTLSSCGNADGSVSVTALGGSGSYSYSWVDVNSIGVGATATVSGLAAGAYTVTVNDGMCESTVTASVSDAGEPEAVIDLAQDPTCFNACDGLIEVTTISGIAPFTYQWSNGSTTEDIIDLCAGTYSLTITDDNGCVEVLQATLTDPEEIILSSTSTATLCAGSCDGEGEVTILSGGIQPVSYDWSGAGNSPISISNTGLCVGTYPVIITDANFCTATVDVTIQEPQAIVLASTSFDLTCFESCDGQVIVIPSGGTENGNGYNIQWENDGQMISTEASVSNLCAGDYSVVVTDDNGCTESITESISQPQEIILTLTQDSANCNMSDGTAAVSVVGGVQPLNVYWDNGSQNMVNDNVAPGTYCVTVMDANACSVQDCIDVENIEGPSLTVVSTDDPDCFDSCDGSIEVDHIGGNSDVFSYTYSLNNGGNQVTSNPMIDLCEGSYTITGTDEHGCIATIDAELISPEEVVVSVSNDTTICIDGCADLSALAAGGIGTYSYEWSTNEITPEITVCPSTNSSYSVIAMDGNGCFSSPQTVNVNLQDSLNLALFTIGPNYVCPGEEITIDASYNGGSGVGYSLTWNPVPDNQINPQEAPVVFTPDGTIMVEATLTDNCETPDVTTMIEIGSYSLDSVVVSPQTDEGCEPLLVSFNTNVTNPNYVYSWDFGDGNASTEESPSNVYNSYGTYTVDLTVSDDNGCTFEIDNSSEIEVFEGSSAVLEVEEEEWDLLSNQVWFDASKSWNTEEYLWNFGDGYSSDGSLIQYTFEDTGSHVVSLITVSPDGCVDSTNYTLEIDPIYTFFAPNAFSPNGDGMNDVFLPQGEGINTEDFEMYIYNRWGEMIYHVTDYQGWDGTAQQGANLAVQIDVYIWYIRTSDPWGNTHTYVGEVAVIR